MKHKIKQITFRKLEESTYYPNTLISHVIVDVCDGQQYAHTAILDVGNINVKDIRYELTKERLKVLHDILDFHAIEGDDEIIAKYD